MTRVFILSTAAVAASLALFLTLRAAWLAIFFGLGSLFAFLSYIVPILAVHFLPEQNLKTKYNASWAFITGGSSGIGKTMAIKLAQQGLNVIIAAVDNADLKGTVAELQRDFPMQSFKGVAVDLTGDPKVYMDAIRQATDSLTVQVLFLNAGYVIFGPFTANSADKQMANMECLSNAHIRITHHFLSVMVSRNLRGAIMFTSSMGGFTPLPGLAMYSVAKSALSMLGASLSVNYADYGIDFIVVHPGPVNTPLGDSFITQLTISPDPANADKVALKPEQVSSILLRGVGRVNSIEIGGPSVFLRLLVQFLGPNLTSAFFSFFAKTVNGFHKKQN